jgi:tetraacyldisaccharide-1-P 4'-kinase
MGQRSALAADLYPMLPPWLAWLLLPFSWLYAAVLAVRNWLYDRGWKASQPGWVPLIGVGNLRVGGTGKTPHVAWVVEELRRQGQRPAILSRGYGRQTKGPRLAGGADSAATVGDEPWQYFQQFGAEGTPVAVAENRQLGLDLLRQFHPELLSSIGACDLRSILCSRNGPDHFTTILCCRLAACAKAEPVPPAPM